MPTSIVPLSQARADAIRDFLVAQGHAREIIDWKYFLPSETERGLVGLDGTRVVSFLGLLPFTVLHHGQPASAAWSCDWYRDPSVSGPLGILLLRQSLTLYPWIYSLGGGEPTRAIMSRLSRRTVANAGMELYRPLRLGGGLRLLTRAARLARVPGPASLQSIPLPARQPPVPAGYDVRFVTQLPDSIAPLLAADITPPPAATTGYDLAYLRWQIEHCPALASGVCLVSEGGILRAAVLFWCPAGDRRFWRIYPFPPEASNRLLLLALRHTLRHLRDRGGHLVSLLLSTGETELRALARRLGFLPTPARRPLFVLSRDPKCEPDELAHLSYLDTDYAYRFPF